MNVNKKNKFKKRIAALIAVVVVVVVVVLLVRGAGSTDNYSRVSVEGRDITSYLEFSGNIEAVTVSNAYPKASAQILELYVEEGDKVSVGDVIAVLDSGDVEYNIALKELSLASSKLSDTYSIKDSQSNIDTLNEQLAQGANQTLNSAMKSLLSAQESYADAVDKYNLAKEQYENGTNSSVVSARQSMENAQLSYDTAKSQYDDGFMTDETLASYALSLSNAKETYNNALESAKREVEDYYEAMLSAEESLADAERDYETSELSVAQTLESYEESLEKTVALSGQESSELELEHLKESLEDYTVYAPIDGYITKLNVSEGDYAATSAAVAEVTDFETLQVAIKIDEYDVVNVSEGDAVQIYIDAIDAQYEGRISRIAKTATIENDVSYLEAIVEFDADDDVRIGFSAEVKLIKADEKNTAALPVGCILYNTDNTAYVMVEGADGSVENRQVSLGVSDGTWVQITDGLEIGDTVLSQNTMSLGTVMFTVE